MRASAAVPSRRRSGEVVRPPHRPGPGAIPSALLRALDLRAGARIAGLVSGEHPASGFGSGTELAQVRPYRVGDDVRLLDPSASARTGEPHVRVNVAERTLVSWLVLDLSPSMDFGTADRRKADVAEGVAQVVGHLSARRGNRVGAIAFGGTHAPTLPPRQGRRALGALRTLLDTGAEDGTPGEGSLGEALRRCGALARSRALVVVVSDLRGALDWERPLRSLAARHRVVCVEPRDRREARLPDVGDVWLVDPESGRRLRVDTARRRIREGFAAAADGERREVAERVRRARAEHVVLSTEGDWLVPLARALERPPRA